LSVILSLPLGEHSVFGLVVEQIRIYLLGRVLSLPDDRTLEGLLAGQRFLVT
jgi:hypothetical protein